MQDISKFLSSISEGDQEHFGSQLQGQFPQLKSTVKALYFRFNKYIGLGQPKSVAPGPGCSEPN